MSNIKIDWKEIVANAGKTERVSKHIIGGRTFYIKRRKKKVKHIERILLKVVSLITGSVLWLAPKFDKNNDFEIHRLGELRAAGINVPQVVHIDQDFFVMSDAGVKLGEYLRNHPGKNSEEYLIKTMIQLAHMHKKGFAHGGAQVRNYCVKDDAIFTIDVEEDYSSKHLEKLKIRDAVLLLYSTQRSFPNMNLQKMIDAYKSETGADIYDYMKRMARKYRFILFLEKPFFQRQKYMKRNIKAAVELIRKFQ